MTTYTIAYTSIEEDDGMSLLLAIVPDGADIDAAARLQIALSGLDEMKPCKYIVRTGLTLTDEEPQDTSRIVWEGGHDRGWLRDETGTAYVYALRTRPVMMFRPQGGSIWSVTIDGKFLDDYDTSEEVPMGEGGQCDLREVEKALRRAFNLGDDVECPVYP